MNDNPPNFWRRLLWLSSFCIFGVILVVLPFLLDFPINAQILCATFGTTFIVIFFLGISVDWWLKKAIIDDVVKVSLGYVLPNELKPAMRWIYNQHIICTLHEQTTIVERHPEYDGIVIVTTTTLRVLENQGTDTEQIRVGIAIDEWFIEGCESKVLEIGYSLGDESVSVIEGVRKQSYGLATQSDLIDLPANGKITIWTKAQEPRHINGAMHGLYSYPTIAPIVTAKADEGIAIRVGFLSDQNLQARQELGAGKTRLNSILLPLQPIEVRWWDEQASRNWRHLESQDTQDSR